MNVLFLDEFIVFIREAFLELTNVAYLNTAESGMQLWRRYRGF